MHNLPSLITLLLFLTGWAAAVPLDDGAEVARVPELKCVQTGGGPINTNVCVTMGLGKPDMVACASGPNNYWQQDNVLKAKKGAYGEFSYGDCAMSVYNRGNKKFQISSALLFNFWAAAANVCMGPDTAYDSAICTVEDPSFGRAVVVVSHKGTNKKIVDKLVPVPK